MSRFVVLWALLAALVAVAGASPPPDSSASDIYLKIKGIDGEAEDGAIAVAGLAWSTVATVGQFEVLSQRNSADVSTGVLPTGIAVSDSGVQRRYNRPVTIIKEVDRASPLLMQALVKNESLDVEVWQRNESDLSFVRRYTLKEAIITRYSVSRGADGASTPTESISFVFEKIDFPSADAQRGSLNSSRSN